MVQTIIPTAINLPSHTFPATLGTLLPMLIGVPKIVFHCNSSKGRGTRTAGWLADALAEYHTKHSPDGDLSREQAESRAADQAVILTGGINAWTEKHGSTSLDQRGKPWDGKSLATIHV
ncbi:hypothetical protein BCV70DRAFT_201859 [Testicularia cyperi]|uniref:Rhodanese domain-containing protein n=1 Tax=Testicularia cyperi TaxID=1882483 RepID=A0A317XKG2_9BASI|nr:hypothetical protein BCV70DRAFT_201859 [Testicularia cyperi]